MDVGEFGMRFWNCVGRCSQVHSDDEYCPEFLRNSLQLGTYANSTALRAALVQWCYSSCGRGEGVQGVLTLFGRGKAQVFHHHRVVELNEQLEVEEEDGDRQEEEVEVASREASQGECAMWMTMDECEMRSELKPWNVNCETITSV